MFGIYFVVHYFVFCNHLDKEEISGCFSLIVFFVISCDRYCPVDLPRGDVGWSAVCDCGILDHTLFLHTVRLRVFNFTFLFSVYCLLRKGQNCSKTTVMYSLLASTKYDQYARVS